jgi:hypothetical protein
MVVILTGLTNCIMYETETAYCIRNFIFVSVSVLWPLANVCDSIACIFTHVHVSCSVFESVGMNIPETL